MLGYTVGNSTHDYMIGLGLGGDLLQIGRHKIYIQGTVGLGTSEMSKDGVSGAPGVKSFALTSSRLHVLPFQLRPVMIIAFVAG